jgi:hypothetical protein
VVLIRKNLAQTLLNKKRFQDVTLETLSPTSSPSWARTKDPLINSVGKGFCETLLSLTFRVLTFGLSPLFVTILCSFSYILAQNLACFGTAVATFPNRLNQVKKKHLTKGVC